MQPPEFSSKTRLAPPARYFPLRNGRYTVTPSLYRFGTDFGNGISDTRLFQFDEEFPRFRENKRLCRKERFSKYIAEEKLPCEVREAVIGLLLKRLVTEYPDLFLWTIEKDASGTLNCSLTGETLHFDSKRRLVGVRGQDNTATPYADAIDALCCQFPEDLSVICRDAQTGIDWLAKLHVCAPSHWAPEEKIGKSWSTTHAPVPGMERSRSAARSIVSIMVEREPTVRFTWGIEWDDRLNQHPQTPPASHDGMRDLPVPYDRPPEPFCLRVERQVIWGLPEMNAAVFTIRVYRTPASVLRADRARREALHSALLSMSPESQQYKGLAGRSDEILSYLSCTAQLKVN
jgi:hypothetical protein